MLQHSVTVGGWGQNVRKSRDVFRGFIKKNIYCKLKFILKNCNGFSVYLKGTWKGSK